MDRNFNYSKMLFCGYEDCKPGHFYGPAIREYYIIHYITEGKGRYETPRGSYELSAGDGFLIVPSEITKYCADISEPWKYSWVAFEGDGITKHLSRAGINAENPVFRPNNPEVEMCFCEMKKHFDSSGNECEMLACMYKFLAILTEGKEYESVQQNYVKRAAEYMKYNFYNGIAVSDVADFVGIDRAYLSKLFSSSKNVTAARYLLDLRMKEAARLVKNRELSIAEISESIGYADQFVFSKAFSRYFGVSPTRYRNKK